MLIEIINIECLDPESIMADEIQDKLQEIKEKKMWSKITLTFQDGKMAYWCEETTHK